VREREQLSWLIRCHVNTRETLEKSVEKIAAGHKKNPVLKMWNLEAHLFLQNNSFPGVVGVNQVNLKGPVNCLHSINFYHKVV